LSFFACSGLLDLTANADLPAAVLFANCMNLHYLNAMRIKIYRTLPHDLESIHSNYVTVLTFMSVVPQPISMCTDQIDFDVTEGWQWRNRGGQVGARTPERRSWGRTSTLFVVI